MRLDKLTIKAQEAFMEAQNVADEHGHQEIAAEGHDPVYGARPLKRVIQRRIQDPLAMKVLAGEVHDGDHVLVDAGEGEFTFTPAPAEVEVEEPVPVA